MDRRPVSPSLSRQRSTSAGAAGGGTTPSSPMTSSSALMLRHARTGSAGVSSFRRGQNNAARIAAQRLARVMAHQSGEDGSSDEEDEETAPPIELSTPRRSARSSSPAIGRSPVEQASTARPISSNRPSMALKQPAMIPPIKSSMKPVITSTRTDSPVVSRRDKRVSVDLGSLNMRETSTLRHSSSLQDEMDVLQEENENNLDQFRYTEERFEQADSRARQPERLIKSLGEDTSIEAYSNRNEAALQKRGSAWRTAAAHNNRVKREDALPLRWESKPSRDETSSTVEQHQELESEFKSIRAMLQKLMLNKEQIEEVVLKRCWLARYWKLCVHLGIYEDIAERKHEYWSTLAPLPVEVVLSAGENAKNEQIADKTYLDDEKVPFEIRDLAGEGSIENMLLVEKGLRELASLKVEESVLFALAQRRGRSIKASQSVSGDTLSVEGSNPLEAFELSSEETEDVLFKQAWLTYFWRRAKNHGVEEDIADDRLQLWIDRSTRSPASQDAVEVERGLFELKKLGIESQLWEASRRGNYLDSSNHGSQTDSES